MEHELSTLLRDKAERVRVDRSRREDTLKRARRGRRFVAGAAAVVATSVVVVALATAASVRNPAPLPAPVERPTEHREPEEEDLVADVRIAEAHDGSWTLFAGRPSDGETLCLELGGGGCVATDVRDGFILLHEFDDVDKEGFIYGPVNEEVAALELHTGDGDRPLRLRLRRFPERLDLEHLRFFVHPLSGEGTAVLVARADDGTVLQRLDISWGGSALPSMRHPRSVVRGFMQRRIAGVGAEAFLDSDGRALFGAGARLGSLYPDPPLEDFEIVFVDDLGDASYEVGVRLIFEDGSYGETLFLHRVDAGFVISGGRPGLEGP